MSPVEAITFLGNGRGTKFDPYHVDAFISMVGAYPPGAMVRLTSSEIGMVVKAGYQPGKPMVKMIIDEIGDKGGFHVISTPYHFEWKGKSYKGLEEDEINALNPDLFLVIIDDLVRVRERLRHDPQWREHSFTLIELSQWRREEILGVYNLSRVFTPHKEYYIVAKEHGLDLLQDLILNRHKKKIYLSHPITGEGGDFFETEQPAHEVTIREQSRATGQKYIPGCFYPLDFALRWKELEKTGPERTPGCTSTSRRPCRRLLGA